MPDWTNLVMCPECGAANPHDGEKCVKCGVDLQAALARDVTDRRERIAAKPPGSSPKSTPNRKPINELTVADLKRHPVWRFLLSRESSLDETWVSPVKSLPVSDLANRVVGTHAHMACGSPIFCLLGSVSLRDPKRTQQFIGLTVFRDDGERFHLARYFDVDYADQGPEALAEFLGRTVEEVFPISYDMGSVARGHNEVTKGLIPAEPLTRLTGKERMELVIQELL